MKCLLSFPPKGWKPEAEYLSLLGCGEREEEGADLLTGMMDSLGPRGDE